MMRRIRSTSKNNNDGCCGTSVRRSSGSTSSSSSFVAQQHDVQGPAVVSSEADHYEDTLTPENDENFGTLNHQLEQQRRQQHEQDEVLGGSSERQEEKQEEEIDDNYYQDSSDILFIEENDNEDDGDDDDDGNDQTHGASIVRNIASFLTLSDVASMASHGGNGGGGGAAVDNSSEWTTTSTTTPGESWGGCGSAFIMTPPTPAIIAVSPTVPPSQPPPAATRTRSITAADLDNRRRQQHHHIRIMSQGELIPDLQQLDHDEDDNDGYDYDEDCDYDSFFWEERLQQRRRKWAQERIAAAIFSHPRPLRSYCLEAVEAARTVQQRQNNNHLHEQSQLSDTLVQQQQEHPETLREAPQQPLMATLRHSPNQQIQHPRQHQRRRTRNSYKHRRLHILLIPIDAFFSSTPVSVMLDVIEFVIETTKDTTFSALQLSLTSMDALISTILAIIRKIWTAITNFNPLVLLDAFISIQFNAMGKTSEVIVSGIQSVATGVGSASNFALQRLSRGGSSAAQHHHHSQLHRTTSPCSIGNTNLSATGGGTAGGGLRRTLRQQSADRNNNNNNNNFNLLNKKLLRKLSSINSAAEVVAYQEVHDDTGGLTKEAKKRVQRMMHYDVSLRPFVATVVLPMQSQQQQQQPSLSFAAATATTNAKGDDLETTPFENVDFPTSDNNDSNNLSSSYQRPTRNHHHHHHRHDEQHNHDVAAAGASSSSPSSSSDSSPITVGDSPFMCTPQSFPPTPSSRRLVMARGSRYVEDVVFLARDQLRVHDALDSANERTRAMANALREGKRLAVFNADDAASGIALTCGQHVATKVGNMLYCTTRSMVPVLRNCFVYFEVTILPRPAVAAGATTTSSSSNNNNNNNNMTMILHQASMATLSIGLSTFEMPLNTLVGAWKGSVGLCTTGQILTAGQWCSPVDPSQSAYGDNATVGCLVCLDDGTAFETWEGLMVTAAVTFSVNGRVVSPPVSSMPIVASIGGMDGANANNVWLDPFQQQQHSATLLPAPPALSTTLPLLVPAEEELYATVSLHSPAASVMCRFSAEDVLAATDRTKIGAPYGVTVYAVDGSVIFEKGD